MNETQEMITTRDFAEYTIGNGKLYIEKPNMDVLSPEEADLQSAYIGDIFVSACQMIARQTGIDFAGELYVAYSPQNSGIHMFESNKSFIGFISPLYGVTTVNCQLREKNIKLATTEILHHFHWLAVTKRGEFEWIRTKTGLALSELIAGHPLMINPFIITRLQDDQGLQISLESICAGGYFRYLLSSAFDIERPLNEDEYEIAFLWQISLREKLWTRKDLFELCIAPSGTDDDTGLVKEGYVIAQLITERNKILRTNDITVPFETLLRNGLQDCHSEQELLSRLRKIYILEQKVYPQDLRSSLLERDAEIEERLTNLRQEITKRYCVEGHVSRLSWLADKVLQ